MKFNYTEEDQCIEHGFDPEKVEKVARSIAKAAKEADKLGLMLFAGCFGGLVLRPKYRDECDPGKADNLTSSLGRNCDGGDGGD